MVGRVFGDPTIALNITSDTADYNVFTAAGSPATAADVVVTIASGIVVYQNAASAAITIASFAAGSTVTITNNGTICGKGGSANAGAGGDAILRTGNASLRINNTNGYIFGGGGGGGRGASEGDVSPALNGAGGGGGGGGRGRVSSSGGTGATNYAVPGASGSGGDFTAAGSGGAGGNNAFYGNYGGAGGAGGDWGQDGGQGDYGQPSFIYGQTGGAAGKAVNGTVTAWLGGYNSTQVRGAVG